MRIIYLIILPTMHPAFMQSRRRSEEVEPHPPHCGTMSTSVRAIFPIHPRFPLTFFFLIAFSTATGLSLNTRKTTIL